MTEKELRPHIIEWLKANGYEVAHECASMHNCDVVGFQFYEREGKRIPNLKRVIAIELKISDFNGVLTQCRSHRYYANQVFAAMPSVNVDKMKYETRVNFSEQGIGLLSIIENGCVAIGEVSLSYDPDFSGIHKALWRWHKINMRGAE